VLLQAPGPARAAVSAVLVESAAAADLVRALATVGVAWVGAGALTVAPGLGGGLTGAVTAFGVGVGVGVPPGNDAARTVPEPAARTMRVAAAAATRRRRLQADILVATSLRGFGSN
jgi:hypothetical protein